MVLAPELAGARTTEEAMPRKKTTTVATYVRSEDPDASTAATPEPSAEDAAAEATPKPAMPRAARRKGKKATEAAPVPASGEDGTDAASKAKSSASAKGAAKRGRKAKAKPTATGTARKPRAAKAAPETTPVAARGEDAPGSAKAAKSPARAGKAPKRGRRAKTATPAADAAPDLPDDDIQFPAQGATLADLAAAFGAHLDAFKSPGTAASYRAEMRLALAVLGEGTVLADITTAMVEEFNGHERVVTTRDGLPKARTGIAKTRRVLRLALEWAAERGIIPSAPLPDATD